MPLPTKKDVRPVDPVLTDLSLGYKNPDFMVEKIAPFSEKNQKSGTYFIYTKDYWFRRPTGVERAATGPYTRVDYGVSTGTYDAQEYGLEKALPDPIKSASQTPEALESVDTEFLTHVFQLELEMQVAAALFVASVWGTDNTLSGTSQWSDYDASDPISDFATAIRTIRQNTGKKPNSAFIGAAAWDKLKEHPLFLEKYKYTQKGIMTPELVAAVIGLDEINVGESVYNSAAEGQTFSGADIWTDNCLVSVVETPGLMKPTGAGTLVWNEKGNFPWGVESYRDEVVRADVQRIFSHWQIKCLASDLGYLFIDTIA